MTGPAVQTMAAFTFPALISRLISGEDLSLAEAEWAMDEVMGGNATAVQLAAFLVALRAKGESVSEIRGLAASMLRHAVTIEVPGPCVDVVGTGGDRHHSVNISTMAALVVAGAGARVVKHGNRAATSSSGSADVLEALGVRLDLPPRRVAEIAGEAGITFLFAQVFHPAFRHAAPARRELGLPTAFNVLGPLTNPARPEASAIGVGHKQLAPVIAGVLAERGDRALVFRSEDGLDELSPTAPAVIWQARDGAVTEHRLDPVTDLGLAPATLADLRGADAAYNAQVARDLLHGKRGAVRDAVVLNAAATLVAAAQMPGTATGDLTDRLRAGMALAEKSIDQAAAAGVLERWVRASNA
ncbi:anthranilate phosphoribosyltransferase [Pseudactinotalea sp. Z1739]|uniref:anthranilate phosphoribosyltransferase n=1 Tax=Pseudactinotalea sp. Z1739 TaxID=3413028 RepID=UPI003C7AAF8D